MTRDECLAKLQSKLRELSTLNTIIEELRSEQSEASKTRSAVMLEFASNERRISQTRHATLDAIDAVDAELQKLLDIIEEGDLT